MKVKILKNTVAAKKSVKAGDILDLELAEAQLLIGIKKAEKFIEEQAKLPVVENEVVSEGEAQDEIKKPAPKKKKG